MSKKSKIVLSVTTLLIFLLLIAYALLHYVYGFGINQEICYSIKDGLVENVTNIQIVDYDWLSSSYKKNITKEEFYSPKSIDEYLTLFNKINAVNSKANFFQQFSLASTDYGKKTASQMVVSNSGNEYLVTHHINVASTFLLKPQIVEWIIDIEVFQG